jgi:hypothetical protein
MVPVAAIGDYPQPVCIPLRDLRVLCGEIRLARSIEPFTPAVQPAHNAPPMLMPPSNLIAGVWEPLTKPEPDDLPLRSHSPADPSRVIWDGSEDPTAAHRAVAAARAALPMWSR